MGDIRAHWCIGGNYPERQGTVVIQQRNGTVARAMPMSRWRSGDPCALVRSWDLGWSIEGPSTVTGWETQYMEQTA